MKSTHDIADGPLVMSLDPFVMRDTLKKHAGLNTHILSGQKKGTNPLGKDLTFSGAKVFPDFRAGIGVLVEGF